MTDYDRDMHIYQEWSVTQSVYSLLEWTTFLQTLGPIDGLYTLDVACGEGRLSRMLMERGARTVLGVDVSAAMIASAAVQNRIEGGERRFETLTYRTMDARDENFQVIHPVDLVTAMYLFHYASSEEELNRMAAFIGRNLKEGGRFVSYTINPEFDFEQQDPKMEDMFGFRYKIIEPPEYRLVIGEFEASMWHWSKDAHEHALSEAGLTDIKWHKLELPADSMDLSESVSWYLDNPSCIVVSARKAA